MYSAANAFMSPALMAAMRSASERGSSKGIALYSLSRYSERGQG
jgi:hypothetical protein